MLVHHDNLYKIRPDWGFPQCFEYSKQAEQALATLLNIDCILATGNHSAFDFTDRRTNHTYEVKFQFKGRLSLEFEQSVSHRPSGIAISTADYWLVVSRGMTMQGEVVGKIRKYSLETLKNAWQQYIQTNDVTGETACKLDPKLINHEWLGDIWVDDSARVWDLTKWKRRARQGY